MPPPPRKSGAQEEDPGRQHADPRVRAMGEVLVDRTGAGEPARVERDCVADREHAEAGSRIASVAFQPAPVTGFETSPRISAVENIGPIASDWATAWSVEGSSARG